MEINEKLVTSFLEILFELKKLEVLKLDLWNSCKIQKNSLTKIKNLARIYSLSNFDLNL